MKDYVVHLRLGSAAGDPQLVAHVKAESAEMDSSNILHFYDDQGECVGMFTTWLFWTIKEDAAK